MDSRARRVQTFHGPRQCERAFARYSDMYTRLYHLTPPPPCVTSQATTPPSTPSSRSDWLKWFVFDLTTATATAATTTITVVTTTTTTTTTTNVHRSSVDRGMLLSLSLTPTYALSRLHNTGTHALSFTSRMQRNHGLASWLASWLAGCSTVVLYL
ncbi:hypothetical protein M0804_013691 [Polistes exclamans]|nr:hypothetical protein M0804_013691 [Polistes exclamans]